MTLPVITTYVRTRLNSPVSPADYGLIADGSSHPLSQRYATLGEAQADYPFATSLTQQIDYCACKLASNIAFGADGSEHGTNSHLNRKLVLPAGVYWFGNDTWTIRNLASGLIEGEGELATIIRGTKTLLAFDGIWFTAIRNMSIQVQASDATAAMELDGNIPGHPYATRGVQGVLLENMLIDGGGSSYALAVCRQGGSGGQGSECLFAKVHLSNASFACYYQNGFNALANQFVGGNVQGYSRNGIYVVGGTISVYGVGFQSTKRYTQIENDGWDINIGDSGSYEGVPVIGCRTESLRFLRNAGSVRTTVVGCVGVVAVPAWFASTEYGPSAPSGKAIVQYGRLFIATTAGTSGVTEPIWPTDGSPVSDGSVIWQEEFFNVIEMPDFPFSGSVDTASCGFSAGRIMAQTTTMDVGRWSQSASIAVDNNETVIFADATNNAITVKLPHPPQRGRVVTVKKVDNTENAVTIQGTGVNIEGAVGSLQIPGGSRGYIKLIYYDGDGNGTRRWQIVGSG